MAEVGDDILEKILIGFDVKELIRFKGVCKSWHSFISSPRFVKSHLNYTCNIDRTDNELAHRRIVCPVFGKHLVGSSNGLVCISPFYAKVVVANPMTLELRKLQNPHIPSSSSSLCWGFGYDSLTEDYKVIVGYKKSENLTCFQVLYLKSDVWKVIGDVNYSFISSAGMLYNGALHWFMSDQYENKVILSFDLSREEFKEIPQPDDVRYEVTSDTSLGIVDNCLCICPRLFHRRWVMGNYNVWVMINYNVKRSWAILKYDNSMIMKYDIAHFLGHIPSMVFFCKDNIHRSRSGDYIGAPLYVKSLVSPHVNGRRKKKWSVMVGSNYHVISWSLLVPHSIPKRKRCAKNGKRNAKLIKGDPSAPGPSA